MLNVFLPANAGLVRDLSGSADAIERALWLDLVDPSTDEEHAVERLLGINVPTRAEMSEIEASSRLHEEDGVLYLTISLPEGRDGTALQSGLVTCILARGRLVTLRYSDLPPFRKFAAYSERHPWVCASAPMVLGGLLEAIVESIADGLESLGADLDALSALIFASTSADTAAAKPDLRDVLQRVGRNADQLMRSRESLVSLSRLLAFVEQTAAGPLSPNLRGRHKNLTRDVAALADHASFVSGKIAFLLDATLGLINIEQNGIIKIFSVASVVFLPPTLIASIYGMNFRRMPELDWSFGYPFAIGLMIASAVLPYVYFKRRGWL
jgi:magnesium transporter